MINFSLIKMQHARWNVKLSHLMTNNNYSLNTRSDTIIFDHHNCDLGKWLQSEGLKTLGGLVAVQQLVRVHQQLHTLGRQIFEAKIAGNISQAEELLAELESVNHQLVNLINKVENEVKTLTLKV